VGQHRWHSLVKCNHGDSSSGRFDSPRELGRHRGLPVGAASRHQPLPLVHGAQAGVEPVLAAAATGHPAIQPTPPTTSSTDPKSSSNTRESARAGQTGGRLVIMCIRVGAHHPIAHPRPHRPLTQGVVQIIHSLVQIALPRSCCIGPRPHIHSAVLWLCDHICSWEGSMQRPAQLTNLAGALQEVRGWHLPSPSSAEYCTALLAVHTWWYIRWSCSACGAPWWHTPASRASS
jgi:hypothetical protein